MKLKIFSFCIGVCILFSCQSVPKDITYLQDFDEYTQQPQTNLEKYEPTIKSNDQLLISVSAPILDQAQVAQFNLPMNTYLAQGETTVSSLSMQTYTVDKNGFINFPVVGEIKLEGLTRSQAIQLISQKVSVYLPDPIINLQISSFKITILGEVARPGTINIPDERITVLDALGRVGDLTIYGNRKNIKLIRDNNGNKEFHTYDLTKSDLLSSPYYYLQQNDILIVEANETRKKASKFGSAENYQISMLSLGFTAVSVIVSFLGILLNK